MKTISRKYEKKDGNKYIETYYSEDKNYVNECFMHALRAKYIHKCTYIKKIIRNNNYDGTETYKIYYDNGGRETYIIAE